MRLKLILICLGALAACASERPCPSGPLVAPKGLEQFYSALESVEQKKRETPVTVLYLGDSHIARDDLTGEMRQRWEAIFGPSARALPAGIPYRYYGPQGYHAAMEGPWKVASSLKDQDGGPFGIQGFRVSAVSPQAHMSLSVDEGKTVDQVMLEIVSGPKSGGLLLSIGDTPPLRIDTKAAVQGLMQLRLPLNGAREVGLSPAGDGSVALLGWALIRSDAKFRFDAYGIVSARSIITDRWDEGIMAAQLKALQPDLIILGYGTNEGFDPAASPAALAQHLRGLITRLKRMAPQSSIAVLGAFDGAKRTSNPDSKSCQPAGSGTANAGWMTPSKLDQSRTALLAAAAEMGVFTWDGSRVMGRPCGIHKWAMATPPLAFADHVHLKAIGARRAGGALWQALMGQYETHVCRQSNGLSG